jgi:hypothetical protein
MEIREVTLNDIKQYKSEAEKSDLTFCLNTRYYGLFNNNELVSFIGILFYANKNIIKNIYVPPANRGKGYFKKMLDYCMSVEAHKRKEASCTPMSINQFLKIGFKVMRKYKNGITKVYYENL